MSITVPTATSPVNASTKRTDKSCTARRVGRALPFKQKKSRKSTKARKSRVLFHYTKEELEPYFHISQKEAAKRLGIAVITLKRICKRGKFNWPYRANKTKELQERNRESASQSGKIKTVKKSKSTRWSSTAQSNSTSSTSLSSPVFVGETRATQEAMRQVLQSLALCAVKIEQEEAKMTAAAMTFAQLPLLCMLENENMVML